jgi:hypothetical protein
MPSKYVPAALLPTGGHLHGRLHGPDHQPFLLAPWAEAPLDPNVWAIGDDMPLSHLTVQAARRRLLHLSLVKTSKGEYVMMKMLHGIGGRYISNSRREPCW